MALSLQNLFCTGSEDFDDEEFLPALEGTAPSFSSNTHITPVRLRPISSKDAQVAGGTCNLVKSLFSEETVAVQVGTKPADTPSGPSLDQDLDDEELLSACSELEAGVTQKQYQAPGQTPNPRLCLRPINQTSQNNISTSNSAPSCQNNISTSNSAPSCQLRPSRGGYCSNPEPRTFTRHNDNIERQSFTLNSPAASGYHAGGRGRGQCQSTSPTSKRPCLRPSLEMQPVTPARTAALLPQSTYPRCTTPTSAAGQGHSWQGGTGSNTLQNTPQLPSRPHQPGALQTPVVTNHLVQLVEAANKTPQVLAWETPPPKARRFPGPAGLLPQQGSGRRMDDILISTPHTPSHGAKARHRSKNAPSQQPMAQEFVRGPWATMKAELSLDENDPACFLRTYSVVMVLRKAALKQLPKNKVPKMAVTLKSLTPANGDASAVFRDATGEIQGTVHHLLLEERESELKPGSVLLLQQVGVFSPSHRNHYLNVTPSNLVKIYPPGEESHTSGVELTPADEADMNSNDTQSHHRSSPSIGQCRPLEEAPSPSSSTTQPDMNWSTSTLTSTEHSRIHRSSSSNTDSRDRQPAGSSCSYSSMRPKAWSPAALYQSSSTTSTPSFTARPRSSPATENADWDMDDLDSLLSELPEDPGE